MSSVNGQLPLKVRQKMLAAAEAFHFPDNRADSLSGHKADWR